jgi:hypothetical protein
MDASVKRFLLGTFACLVIAMASVMLAARWPALLWLLVLSIALYLLFGCRVKAEFRLGIDGGEARRVYGALTWRRQTSRTETAATQGPDGFKVGSQWRGW